MTKRYDTIKFRRGTAAEWAASEPQPGGEVLRLGEPGYEKDTGKLKIGDGVTPWNSLDYIAAGIIVVEDIDHLINDVLQAGSGINLNFNDSTDTLTVSVSGLINNPTNNRILTSRDDTTTGIDAESNFTFDGSRAVINCVCPSGSSGFTAIGDDRATLIRQTCYGNPIEIITDDGSIIDRPINRQIYFSARGSASSPSGLITNDIIFSLRGDAYNSYGTLNSNGNLDHRTIRILGYASNSGTFYQASSLSFETSSGGGTFYDNLMLFNHDGILSINGIPVSLEGHTHSSTDITDFSTSVSGLLPIISNSGDNRILTSTGSSVGINAESNLTFSNNNLTIGSTGLFGSIPKINIYSVTNESASLDFKNSSGSDRLRIIYDEEDVESKIISSDPLRIQAFAPIVIDSQDDSVSINASSGVYINSVPVSVSGHTHLYTDITNFASGVEQEVSTLLVAGNYINLNYNDIADTLTISATGLQPSGVYASGIHTHTASQITDFNEAVDDRIGSGLFVAGTGINLTYNDSGNSFTVSVSGLINNPTNNRILTSRDNTTTGIDAESNLTFDGNLLSVNGNLVANSGTFDVIQLNTDNGPVTSQGQLAWNDTEGTVDIALTNNAIINIGEHEMYRIRNTTSNVLYKGQAVYASGVHANGIILPNLYTASGSIREIRFMGLIYENVNDNSNGYVIHFGHINNIDTRGNVASNIAVGDETWNDGDILYVHPTVPGKLTKNEPKHSIAAAIILDAANNGKIFVRPTSYGHLDDNHDVAVSGATNGQFLQYNSSTDYWVPSSSGNFTTLLVNGTGVSVSGHTHTSSDITDFNSSVSGLLPTISNSGDNRILTSTGSSTGVNAETNATFDGSTLAVSGAITVDNLRLDGNTLSSTNSNGNIIISPSGTGALQRDNGGDARGQYAADWQTVRSSGTMVAAGNYSVIGGGRNNTSSGGHSTVSGGYRNTSSGTYCTVGGGRENTSSGYVSTVGGGKDNTSSSNYSTVAGGYSNNASGDYSTVGGGKDNTSSGYVSTVSGGYLNTSSGSYSTVAGGYSNNASGDYSTVSGGRSNTSSGYVSTVGGGKDNTSSGFSSTVGGGRNNTSSGYGSTVGGGYNNTSSAYFSTVGGGSSNSSSGSNSTVGGGVSNTSSGYSSTVGGGVSNISSGYSSTVSGGDSNTSSGYYSTVGGGQYNTSSSINSTVSGGKINTSSGYGSTVGGGGSNTSSGNYSTVSGGNNNTSSGNYSTVGGGNSNTSSGNYSTVSGGGSNISSGYVSTVSGGRSNTSSGYSSTVGGGAYNTSSGYSSTVGGGSNNTSSGTSSTVSGGDSNTSSNYSTVGGGVSNTSSGYSSTVGGGVSNTSSGYSSTVGGGGSNTSSGNYSTVGGGNSNTSSGYSSTVGGGVSNTSSGYSSTVGGGGSNTSSGNYSTVPGGFDTKATRYGELSHAAGRFTNNGDAQHSMLVARTSTLSGTFTVTIANPAVFTKNSHNLKVGDTITLSTTGSLPTGLNTTTTYHVISTGLTLNNFRVSTSPGGSAVNTSGSQSGTHSLTVTSRLTLNGAIGATTQELLTLPAETTWTFNIKLSAYNDTDNEGGWWIFRGGIRRNADNTALIGSLITESGFESSFNTASTSVVADDTNEALEIRVTGVASKNIRWVAVVDISQVSYGII